uniref:Unspecific monooxygenase n=1 Tax=Heligmosomoides polygyrus TaxID=6339 RepID=A0A8L8KRI5_HELPZ
LLDAHLFIFSQVHHINLVSGPVPLPLIGNLHQLGYKMFVQNSRSIDVFREWAKEYGDIFTVWIGPLASVNICDYATAVDCMVKKGSHFRGQNKNLRYYSLFWAASLQKDEAQFFALKEKLDESMKRFTIFDMLISEGNVNWPLTKQRAEKMLKTIEPILDFIRAQIDQRKSRIDEGLHSLHGEGDDYVDAYLIQMNKDQGSGSPTSFDDEMLVMALLDMWTAGQETTVATLGWAFSYLLLNPAVREAVPDLGYSSVRFKQRRLQEVHRCASIVPMNLWRDSSEDSIVGPFVIPKGTAITAQLSVIMTDEKHFQDPLKFNPDRYLNGNKLDQMVIPFGLGKRSCLGESLAQAELYLVSHSNVTQSTDHELLPCPTPICFSRIQG